MSQIIDSNILEKDELAQIVAQLRQAKKTIIATNGCFDILHVGHLWLLNQAKALGDILIVGINSDRSVRELKGLERPIVNEKDRAQVIANLKAVDYVSVFDEANAVELLKILQPDIYVKGGDYNLKNLPEADPVLRKGGKVHFIEFMPRKSSTSLIDKIKALS